MARPKSEDKRNAILASAIHVFAESGLSAPTSAISRAAGVAEGTLFTYFPTKEDLINELYRELKLDLADAMMSGFPRRASVKTRLHHIFDQYVLWGVKNSNHHRVLRQIEVWSGLTPESQAAGAAPFAEIETMADEPAIQRMVRHIPPDFIPAAIESLASATMDLIRQHPRQAEKYRKSGFQMLWAAVTSKS